MLDKDEIITKLLSVISGYQKDGLCKELILDVKSHDTKEVSITKLITRGTTAEETPFYSASMSTMIIKEYWSGNEVVNASIIWEEQNEYF